MATVIITVTVTSPGTRQRVRNTLEKVAVIDVKARDDNTGAMYFGTSDVASTQGRELKAGKGLVLNYVNPITGKGSELFSVFWVDADNSTDELDVTAITS